MPNTTKKASGWYVVNGLHIVRTDSHGDPGWDWLVTDDASLALDLHQKAHHGGKRDLRYDSVLYVANTLRDCGRWVAISV